MTTERLEPTPFTTVVRAFTPPWLQRRVGGAVMLGMAELLDLLTQRTVASLQYRFPGYYGPDSLPHLSRDRRIPRGPLEGEEEIAARLRTWWEAHRTRGNAYMLLTQLYLFLRPFFGVTLPGADLIYHSGTRRRLAADGTITRDAIDWNADGSDLWSQAWLIYDMLEPPRRVFAFDDWAAVGGASVGSSLDTPTDPDVDEPASTTVTVSGDESGAESDSFASVDGEELRIVAWIRANDSRNVRLQLASEIDDRVFAATTEWQRVEFTVEGTGSPDTFLFLNTEGEGSGTLRIYALRITRFTDEQLTAIPREWNAGHVLPMHVVAIWDGVELWGYPTGGTWADDDPEPGQVWPPNDPVILEAS